MANGLRKLIKKATKQLNSNTLGTRANRLGRLHTEELEERIAPAAVTLSPSEYATWDISAGDGAFNASDGFIGLASTSSGIDSITIENLADGGATDTATLNITVTDSAADAAVIIIGCSTAIGTINLSGLHAGTTSVTLIIGSGLTTTGNDAGDDDQDFTINGTGYTCLIQEALAANVGDPAIANGAENFTGVANSGIGAITFGSVTTANVPVSMVVIADGTGAIGAITSTDTDLDWSSTSAASVITSGTSGQGNIAWAGDVLIPAANAITVTSGGAVGTVSFGSMTNSSTANFSLTGASISTIGTGNVAASSTGTIGFTSSGTTIGAVTVGTYTTTGNSNLGFTSTTSIASLTTGALSLASGGDLTVAATTSVGDVTFGTVGLANASTIGVTTTTAIGNVVTGAITQAGTGNMAFAATTSIGNVTTGAITGSSTGNVSFAATTTLGNVNMGAIALSSTGDVTATGTTVGTVTAASITTTAGALVTFTANGATGTMGNVAITNSISAGNGASTITFQANDGMGTVTVGGSVGGTAGAVVFDGDAGGTATTGNVGAITVTGTIGDGAATVDFGGANLGNITAAAIGTGAGAVGFTADGTDATNNVGTIGTLTVTADVASGAGGVTFTADDGMGNVTIGGDAAQGGNLTFDVNQDATDDAGAMGTLTAQTLGDSNGATVVTIDTNSGATDNTTERGVGAITVTDGNAKLSITAAGDVALISVAGGNGPGVGNEVDIDLLNLNAAGDGTNVDMPDFAGITIADTAGVADTLTVGGNWTIPGIMGALVVGGADAADVFALGANNINIYAGDDIADGFDAGYATTQDSKLNITAGNMTGTGNVTLNAKAASNLLTYVKAGETFAVAGVTGVTATLLFEADTDNTPATNDERVTVTSLAGTSFANDFTVTTSGASDFDVAGITPAADGLNVRNIRIEGELLGNLGTAVLGFGDVQFIGIQGADNGNTFFGNSLMGYASTDNLLVLTGVDVRTLDTAADGTADLILSAGSIANFADTYGADTLDAFNHHIGVTAGAAGATATIRGIDGAGNSTADAAFLMSGTGVSLQAVDPNDLISGSALISYILLDGVGGLSTDSLVREVNGSTNGSFLEFETSVGLVNITTQIDSISVGIDDNSDLADNAVSTSIAVQADTRANFDRLGGGLTGLAAQGLAPATSVVNAAAVLGNLRVASIGDSGVAGNISIVVTGDSGPINLTGDATLDVRDRGNFVTNNNNAAAAIAIGGNLAGAITIPGQLSRAGGGTQGADILIGIAVDADNDGTWTDDGGISGAVSANITIGDAPDTDILVANAVTGNVVVSGVDNNPEAPGLDFNGDLRGVKAGGNLGVLGTNVVVVGGQLQYVISDAALNSGIYSNGNGENVVIEGVGIAGPAVLGGANGIAQVDVIDHALFGDAGNDNRVTTNGTMTVQWTAGSFAANDTIGDVYIQGAATAFTVANINGDSLNVRNLFFVDAAGATAITSTGNIGVVVRADDVTITSSETLLDQITTAPGHDVVASPTALDTACGDEAADLSFTGTIIAENADGILAEGNITIGAAGIQVDDTLGYLVALNGSIDASAGDVKAGVAIGSIVASTNIDGTFLSEGTLGVGTPTALAANLTSWGLSGVPAWFLASHGGVLSEVGNIGFGSDENGNLNTGVLTATGNGSLTATDTEAVFKAAGIATGVETNEDTDPEYFWVNAAMGTFYTPAGSISAEIEVGGSFGGLQAPSGSAFVQLNVANEATINRIIVPNNFHDDLGNTASAWNVNRVNVLVINGEDVVVVGAPLTTPNMNVTVTGADTLAIVDLGAGNVTVVDGLSAGNAITIAGDVNQLLVQDTWAGTVNVTGNAQADTDGVVNTIITGTIAATADLNADNYGDLRYSSILGTQLVTTTIDGNEGHTWTNMAGDQQTFFLVGSNNNVSARLSTLFGKLQDVQITGKGSVGIVSVNDTVATVSEAKAIIKNASNGGLAIDTLDDSTAHVGTIGFGLGSNVKLNGVVVDGDLEELNTAKSLNKLFVTGNATDVAADTINKAFIGGDSGTITARTAKGLEVRGDVALINAFTLNKVAVTGTVDMLNISGSNGGHWLSSSAGKVINSFFGDGVLANNFNYDINSAAYNPVRVIHTAGI